MRAGRDYALIADQGARDYQEDSALFADGAGNKFDGQAGDGSASLLLVLADGMGGHAAGDVASQLAIESFRAAFAVNATRESTVPERLRSALAEANQALGEAIERNPNLQGMGCTLIGAHLEGDLLHWVSVGDSSLLHISDARVSKLNKDHSMASQIDAMVSAGELTAEEARNHPDRNALLSAVMGRKIARIDCPDQPVRLAPGEMAIVASDGLDTISHAEISRVIKGTDGVAASEIVERLCRAVLDVGNSYQDNVTIMAARSVGDGAKGGGSPGPALQRRGRLVGFLIGVILFLLGVLTAFLLFSWHDERDWQDALRSLVHDESTAETALDGPPPTDRQEAEQPAGDQTAQQPLVEQPIRPGPPVDAAQPSAKQSSRAQEPDAGEGWPAVTPRSGQATAGQPAPPAQAENSPQDTTTPPKDDTQP